MKQKASVIAQKLLNLYRQAHVIIGGWGALNPIFVEEATPDVLSELSEMPTGKMLVKHIENLKSGATPMDSIERDLLPYGGMMAESSIDINIKQTDWNKLVAAINAFTPDQKGLDLITSLPIVKSYGEEWPNSIRLALAHHSELLERWTIIEQTYNAFMRWNTANELLANPLTERSRAQLQADLPEYETYLPMFGEEGTKLLEKLRNSISSLQHNSAN
ncbi:MAG: hypothetical protein IKP05_02145 [Alphaproteobacteria bacterium]|nr:hypothetical protein [Alphaproteobacteria bacterium]